MANTNAKTPGFCLSENKPLKIKIKKFQNARLYFVGRPKNI